MSEPLVIVGVGGFGREALDVVRSINRNGASPAFNFLGFVDDRPSDANLNRVRQMGETYLGTQSDWFAGGRAAKYVIGIGHPATRCTVDKAFNKRSLEPATLIHPSAVVGSNSVIGLGSVICAGVQISTNAILGRHVHVNPNATIGHDVVIDDFVSINPASTISGNVCIRQLSLIGANAVILQGLEVGPSSTVGAGACVTKIVDSDTVVKGIPAR